MRRVSLGRIYVPALALFAMLAPGVVRSAAARTLEEVMDRGVFAVCAAPDALPASSRDGVKPGFEIELAELIAKRLGVRLDVDWIEFTSTARVVNCDAIMGALDQQSTSEDETDRAGAHSKSGKQMRKALSRPYIRQVTRIVARDPGPPTASLADLRKIEVAVPPASFVHYRLDTDGVHVRTRFLTELDIMDAVAAGQVAAGAVPDWYYGWYQKRHPEVRLRIENGFVIDPDLDYNVGIALRNTDQDLLHRVNAILGNLIADGTVQRLFQSYGIAYRPPTSQ